VAADAGYTHPPCLRAPPHPDGRLEGATASFNPAYVRSPFRMLQPARRRPHI